jgi:hypothetical protein
MIFIINITKKMLINLTRKIRTYYEPPMLGRWSVKGCNNKMTDINSIYQNRDHCGDNICKTPIKAEKYMK